MTDITFESLLASWWEYQKLTIFTSIPAVVVGVSDIEQGRVHVKPLINEVGSDGVGTEWPTILSVPVIFPSSNTTAITFPIDKGDGVLLVFSQQGLDVFKSGDGSFASPSDLRMFDRRDAVAIPGLWPFSKSKNKKSSRTLPHSTDDCVIAHNIGTDSECEVRLTSGGGVIINGVDTTINTSLDTAGSVTVGTGATGSFTTPLGQIVTVTDGIITNIF